MAATQARGHILQCYLRACFLLDVGRVPKRAVTPCAALGWKPWVWPQRARLKLALFPVP